eukprot:TRINITY_DN39799_c0_g1_i1.p1 TRINITY_DN39799_c0_g1~~TRINITY_DN39799_c0_g1_i1.p1  ORF type:complete len:291 (+),score=42.00 TRINITY_DN39799_c0_g1_i1:158-1030(+)
MGQRCGVGAFGDGEHDCRFASDIKHAGEGDDEHDDPAAAKTSSRCSELAEGLDEAHVPPASWLGSGDGRHVDNFLVKDGCGASYTGQVGKDDEPHGLGRQQWPDGSVYSGAWLRGRAHGRGKLSSPGGVEYDGSWIAGKRHGSGLDAMADGSSYRGEFGDGKRHGRGTLEWPCGATYEGEFAEDELHGEGTYSWSDGHCYHGQWRHGRMHGQGRLAWPDGRFFDGVYEDGTKHGPGLLGWTDGSRRVGNWLQGKQHGVCTHVDVRGFSRRARWDRGVFAEWLEPEPKSSG